MSDPRAKDRHPLYPPIRFQVVEAARYLAIGTSTLQRRTRDGLIRSHKDGGNTFWLRSDLDAYADAQAQAATEAEPTPIRKAV